MSCPVCFNAATSDDTVRQSINLGIFVMMGVTGGVLAGFLRFIVSIVRRSQNADVVGAGLKVGPYNHSSRPRSENFLSDSSARFHPGPITS